MDESGRRGLTAKQAPRRPGTAPALGLRAGSGRIHSIADHSRKETPMFWLRSLFDQPPGLPFRPTLEALEARDAPSGLGHPTDYSGFLSGGPKDGGCDEFVVIVGHGHNPTYIAGN
jgi:hypothetical protein